MSPARHRHLATLRVCSDMSTPRQALGYFVVMIDYGRRGFEAVVDPEVTRRGIIDRIKSGEYEHIAFIHHVEGGLVEDVTAELIDTAEMELREIA